MTKEYNVDVLPFGAREILEIKEPGSTRHPGSGRAIRKITTSVEEGYALYLELKELYEHGRLHKYTPASTEVRDSETLDDGV